MNIPESLFYTADHEWVKDLGEGIYRIGITDYAQDALGDVVFVEVKGVGTEVAAEQPFGEVESTKSVSELYAPIPGTINSVNVELETTPELLNTECYEKGWICEIKSDQIDIANLGLMIPQEYKELVN